MTKISIITPTIGRPEFLRRCIKAIQHQTFTEYEHIIISDGCISIKSIVDEFHDDKIKYYFKEKDPNSLSCSLARMFGIEKAKSNFIVYCDDDNVLLPNHCKVLYAEYQKGEYECIFSREYHIENISYQNVLNRKLFDFSGYNRILPNGDHVDAMHIGHTKRFMEKYGGWTITNQHSDDGPIIRNWIKIGAPIKYIKDITSIYFNIINKNELQGD